MTQELKERIAKIYELVNRGTDGEKKAAKAALDRIVKMYNIDESDLQNIGFNAYKFTYSSNIEILLLLRLVSFFDIKAERPYFIHFDGKKRVKQIGYKLTYIDWATLESGYEYFRAHMMKEFKRVVAPKLVKCRTNKGKNKRRKELQDLFINQYCIASNLFKPEEIITVTVKNQKEIKDRTELMGVEGGQYNRQIVSNLLLKN